jgi:hypothetical protein
MKLTAQNVYGSTIVLATIMRETRAMPQRGKYLVARMHAKLLPEFNVLNARRDEMIKAYNTPQTRFEKTIEDPLGGREVPIEGEWKVPADKMSEFSAAWKALGDEELDIDVQPIPLAALSLPDGADGSVEAHELATLGDLVSDA